MQMNFPISFQFLNDTFCYWVYSSTVHYIKHLVLSQNCGFQVFLLFSFSSSLFKCMIIKSIPSVLKPKKYIAKTKPKNHMEDNYIILLNKF